MYRWAIHWSGMWAVPLILFRIVQFSSGGLVIGIGSWYHRSLAVGTGTENQERIKGRFSVSNSVLGISVFYVIRVVRIVKLVKADRPPNAPSTIYEFYRECSLNLCETIYILGLFIVSFPFQYGGKLHMTSIQHFLLSKCNSWISVPDYKLIYSEGTENRLPWYRYR